jgi:hypothetical protein
MLFPAPAGEASHRTGTETAATNIHGHLLISNTLLAVLKIFFSRFFAGSIQECKGVSVQVHYHRVRLLLMIKSRMRIGWFR